MIVILPEKPIGWGKSFCLFRANFAIIVSSTQTEFAFHARNGILDHNPVACFDVFYRFSDSNYRCGCFMSHNKWPFNAERAQFGVLPEMDISSTNATEFAPQSYILKRGHAKKRLGCWWEERQRSERAKSNKLANSTACQARPEIPALLTVNCPKKNSDYSPSGPGGPGIGEFSTRRSLGLYKTTAKLESSALLLTISKSS